MGVEITTRRSRRTWLERLSMWQRAYETKVFDNVREVVGRGRTPQAAQDAALKRWGLGDEYTNYA